MPNRAVPTALKVLRGNPGRRPLNKKEPQIAVKIPQMPDWLNEFPNAVDEWKRESVILLQMRCITDAEQGILAVRCYIMSQIMKLAKEIKDQDYVAYTQKMDSLGNEVMEAKPNPRAVRLEKFISEYLRYGSMLGLDPVSRTKIKADVLGNKSEWDEQ